LRKLPNSARPCSIGNASDSVASMKKLRQKVTSKLRA
jgi:hypothetical protein